MKITQDNHAHSVIECYEYRGYIVLIHRAGSYPSVTNADGVCTKTAPHISVCITANYAAVTAVGEWVGGSRQLLPIIDHNSPRGPQTTEADFVAYGKTFLDRAVDAIPTIKSEYAAADEQMRRVHNLPSPLTRADYEAACSAWGVQPRDDAQLDGWGNFSFPSYRGQSLLAALLHQKRGFSAVCERKADEERARNERVAALKAATDNASNRPVKGRKTTRELANLRKGDSRMIGNDLWTVTGITTAGRISEDDPSIYGSHLLGHEGECMVVVDWDVK